MPKPIDTTGGRDHFRRNYVGKRNYTDAMRTLTDGAVNAKWKRKHSESKKPYVDQDYPTMEYEFDPWTPPSIPPWRPPNIPPTTGPPPPGTPWDPPPSDPPRFPWEPNKPPITPGFYGCDFYPPLIQPVLLSPEELGYANLAIGDAETGIQEMTLEGPADFYGGSSAAQIFINYKYGRRAGGFVKIFVKAWSSAKINAHPTYKNMTGDIPILLTVRMSSYTGGPQGDTGPPAGAGESPGVCTALGFVQACPAEVPIVWSDDNPQTIANGSMADIQVEGGRGPYTWTVSGGSGFFLSFEKTDGPNNFIFTSASPCGSADITVTDSCGDEATGSIRATTGLFYKCEPSWYYVCPCPGMPDTGPTGADGSCRSGIFQKKCGGWSVVHCYQYSNTYGACSRTCGNTNCYADPGCFYDIVDCHPVLGCITCLTPYAFQYVTPWEYKGNQCGEHHPAGTSYCQDTFPANPESWANAGQVYCLCVTERYYQACKFMCGVTAECTTTLGCYN